MVYVDGVNILGRSVHAVKKSTESLVGATYEICVAVNAENTKYKVVSRDQNVGQNYSMKVYNKSFERMEQFKYLGTA